ncbi:hypothetical protein chiPu_0022607 [Chiloscyllium punctatum]|uniref:Uncharacterized protein n=1 Tax=Chiloscyllium punctatum TaxID=137246 RepID=A0A401RG04_CHIPU|nr:hypothetical protein [Chiloscyllium punctatum]
MPRVAPISPGVDSVDKKQWGALDIRSDKAVIAQWGNRNWDAELKTRNCKSSTISDERRSAMPGLVDSVQAP